MKYTTLLIIIYYVLTMLFPSDNPFVESQRIYPQGCMAIICLYLYYDAIKNRHFIMGAPILKMFIPLVIIGFIYIPYPSVDPFGQSVVKSNFIWFLKNFMGIPFMFYVYTQLQNEETRTMKYIYIIFAIQVIYSFYSLWYDRQMYLILDREVFDSNAGFILVSCMPMALLVENKRISLYLCLLLSAACVYSGQRSAALTAAVAFPVCYKIIKSHIKLSDVLILGVAFLSIGLPILLISVDNILLRNEIDVAHGQVGSGRGEFWMYVWEGFWNGDIFQIILGNGTATVPYLLVKKYGLAIFSHNGWLDYLYSYGLVGAIIYARSIFSLYKAEKEIAPLLPEYKNLMLSFFLIFLVKCSTSHGNWDISSMPMAMGIAIIAHKYTKSLYL